MRKKDKVVAFVVSFVIILVKSIYFVPVYINGGLAGLINKFGYISLIQYYFGDVSCDDCFYYKIIGYRYVLEILFCFVVCLLLSYLIFKLANIVREKVKKCQL